MMVTRVPDAKPSRLLTTPPQGSAPACCRRLCLADQVGIPRMLRLDALTHCPVTVAADTPQVIFVPEQTCIALMWDDVISLQHPGVSMDDAADAAGE